MSDYACVKCSGTGYRRDEMRAEGGFWSAAFDVSTNRFAAVSCTSCGYTELYRTDLSGGSKLFDFLTS